MPARICPHCRELNSVGEPRCHRCGRRLPGPAVEGAMKLYRELLGVEAPMTRLILLLELLVFGLCVLSDRSLPLGLSGGFKASTLLRFGALAGPLAETEPWRVLSAVFVHMGLLHVVMNLWVFTDLGRELERAVGGPRHAVIFLGTGVLGFVASNYWYAWMGEFGTLTAGASGGVFGQIGAGVGIMWGRRDPEWKKAGMRALIYAVLLSLIIGQVNTAAHLGGFAAGVAMGFVFGRERPRWRLEMPMRVLAGLGIVAVIVSVGLSARSPVWQVQRARELYYE